MENNNLDNVYIHRIGWYWIVGFVVAILISLAFFFGECLCPSCEIVVTSQESIIGIDYVPQEMITETAYVKLYETIFTNDRCNIIAQLRSINEDGVAVRIKYADGFVEDSFVKYGKTCEYFATDMQYQPDNGCDVAFSITPVK